MFSGCEKSNSRKNKKKKRAKNIRPMKWTNGWAQHCNKEEGRKEYMPSDLCEQFHSYACKQLLQELYE
jgi:hypothetical protein